MFDVGVRDVVQRMIERTVPGDEAFSCPAEFTEPEQPVAHPFPNGRQGLVLHLRRRGRRVLVFDMPIHRVQVDRPAKSVAQ